MNITKEQLYELPLGIVITATYKNFEYVYRLRVALDTIGNKQLLLDGDQTIGGNFHKDGTSCGSLDQPWNHIQLINIWESTKNPSNIL